MLKISITNWQHVNHPREDDNRFLNHAINFWNLLCLQMMSMSHFECWQIIADNSSGVILQFGGWAYGYQHITLNYFSMNLYCGLRIGQIYWNYWSFRGMQTSNVYLVLCKWGGWLLEMCLKEIDYENRSLMEFAHDHFWCWCIITLDCWYMLNSIHHFSCLSCAR
jgi:hypothetical protein